VKQNEKGDLHLRPDTSEPVQIHPSGAVLKEFNIALRQVRNGGNGDQQLTCSDESEIATKKMKIEMANDNTNATFLPSHISKPVHMMISQSSYSPSSAQSSSRVNDTGTAWQVNQTNILVSCIVI